MKGSTRNGGGLPDETASQPFRVRLPGFVAGEEIGLGDVVSRIGYAVGMAPCGGCHERRERLNRRVVFTR